MSEQCQVCGVLNKLVPKPVQLLIRFPLLLYVICDVCYRWQECMSEQCQVCGVLNKLVPKPVQLLIRFPLQISVADGAVWFFTHFIIQTSYVGCKIRIKIM